MPVAAEHATSITNAGKAELQLALPNTEINTWPR